MTGQGTTFDARELFTRYVDAVNRKDLVALEKMLHPDFVGDTPQSGERVRGFAALKAQLEAWPGGLLSDSVDPNHARIVEDTERWAISPGFTVVPMAQPDRYTTVALATYPDGRWWVITDVQLRDGLVYRTESYFAPELPAPLLDVIGKGPRG